MSERKAYFAAADRSPENGGSAANQATTANTRQKLASDLIYRAEQVASAIKTMRTFDGTGHALDTMPHLQTTVDDLNAAWKALAQNVANFVAKGSGVPQKFALAVDVPREPLDNPIPSKTWQQIRDTRLEKFARAVDEHLEASIARHPAGSALAAVDAAEAKAAGEPTLQQLGAAFAAVDAAEAKAATAIATALDSTDVAAFVADKQATFYPKPAPGTRRLKDRPQA